MSDKKQAILNNEETLQEKQALKENYNEIKIDSRLKKAMQEKQVLEKEENQEQSILNSSMNESDFEDNPYIYKFSYILWILILTVLVIFGLSAFKNFRKNEEKGSSNA